MTDYSIVLTLCTKIGTLIAVKKIISKVLQTTSGNMPMRDWLLELSRVDRKRVGAELKTVELG